MWIHKTLQFASVHETLANVHVIEESMFIPKNSPKLVLIKTFGQKYNLCEALTLENINQQSSEKRFPLEIQNTFYLCLDQNNLSIIILPWLDAQDTHTLLAHSVCPIPSHFPTIQFSHLSISCSSFSFLGRKIQLQHKYTLSFTGIQQSLMLS